MAQASFILIAEDDPAHAEAIRRAFESVGAEVRVQVVGTLGEYRRAIAERRPDIALVDVNLPDGRALEILTSPPEAGGFPVIVMTSFGNEQMVVDVMKAGAIDYLAKSAEAFATLPRAVQRSLDQWALLQKHKRAEEALRALATSFAPLAGKEFFDAVSAHIATSLGLDYVFVGQFDEATETVSSLGGFSRGQGMPEFTYALTDTPCANVIDKELCVYPQNVQSRFPRDPHLAEMEVEGYVGAPIFDKQRRPIGILVGMHTRPLPDPQGIVQFFSTFLDRIAAEMQRAKVQVALEASEERFRTLIEAVTDYTYRVSIRDGRVVQTVHGPGCLAVTGYSPEEFLADPGLWIRIVPAEDQAGVYAQAARLASGAPAGPIEHRILHRSGEIRWVRSSAVLRYDPNGRYTGYEGLIQDVSEYKRLQGQVTQAQKMEAIGRLAGGVAHDFRNQLTVIRGYGEMILRRSLVNDEGRRMLEEILKAAERSTTTTGQLLAFSRKETLRPAVQSVRDCVADIGKILPHMVGEDIRMAIQSGMDPCHANIDPHLFQQAVMNLATNARDAMPAGGTLSIETTCQTLGPESRRIDPELAPGPYVVVSVNDTGVGMDEATAGRVFDPFFTTKEVGKGTGLGLPMVYGFVKQSGGAIAVETEPGRGTTVRLYFPCVDPAPAGGAPGQGQKVFPGGKETILVVEDEPAVRAMAAKLLAEAGYRVLVAASAEEALALVNGAENVVDSLVTDIVMPGMGGVALAQTLRARYPNLGLLYISGYPGDELSKRGVDDSMEALGKPFTSEAFLAKVRLALDARRLQPGR